MAITSGGGNGGNSGTSLSVSIGANTTQLQNGLNNANNAIDQFVRNAERIGEVGDALTALGARLSIGITLPIVTLGKEAIEAYGEIQALQKGLEAVSGSASFANKQFGQLKEVAKLPGLGLQEAVKGSINLQSIGISAGNAKNILQQFGNAIATVGKGRVEFERAIYGVQQLANTDFPLGEDLNIIKDAVPQVSSLLKEAFGTSRSDDLQKLKISSKQVLDVIVNGLEKLPRVAGGIKGAFENLGDSTQQNLARIGKSIDDNFNISGIIDKLTDAMDNLITRFEELSPVMQKTIIVSAGLAAATGPLLLGLGGILTLAPLVVNGFNGIKTAALALNRVILANPYAAVAVGLAALGAALYLYYSNLETAKTRQDRLNTSLAKAAVEARNETDELRKLYETSQDQKKSLEERKAAVDQLQKQYPGYFANIKDEIILAGQASGIYKQLTVDIYSASRARAAQAELDKRNAKRLEEDIELQNELRQSVEDYNKAKDTRISSGEVGSAGKIGDVELKRAEIQENAVKRNRAVLNKMRDLAIARQKEDAFYLKTIEQGQAAVAKLDTPGADTIIPGLPKVKKEKEKQLAEIYPLNSIAELKQRAALLVKAIETTNNDIVKVRGLDKYGKETNKDGVPFFTGEVLSLEKAYERLQDIKEKIGEVEIEPISLNSRGLLDRFGNEYKTFNDYMYGQVVRTGTILGTELPKSLSQGETSIINSKIAFEEVIKQFNESLADLIPSTITSAITDVFSSIGEAIAKGGNVVGAIGNSLVKAFGGFLSALGGMLVKYGTLAVTKGTLDEIIKTGGYQAIAAGIAAIAVGAALSVAGSAIGTSASAGMNNVSTSTGASTPSNFSSSNYSGITGGDGTVIFRISGPDLIGTFNRNVQAADRVTAG